MDLRRQTRLALGAMRRYLRDIIPIHPHTLPRPVARHGKLTLYPHHDYQLLVSLRRLQGAQTQGGRHLTLRPLTTFKNSTHDILLKSATDVRTRKWASVAVL